MKHRSRQKESTYKDISQEENRGPISSCVLCLCNISFYSVDRLGLSSWSAVEADLIDYLKLRDVLESIERTPEIQSLHKDMVEFKQESAQLSAIFVNPTYPQSLSVLHTM